MEARNPNWITFHEKGKVICLTYLRIYDSGINEKFYIHTDEPNFDFTFYYAPANTEYKYVRISPICIASIFEWQLYQFTEDGRQIYLLSYDEEKLKRTPFHLNAQRDQ